MKPKFKLSYRGESEYLFNGQEYRVRYFAQDDGHYTGNYYKTGIEPFVGCLSNRRDFNNFPSEQALQAFAEEYPGIVGARYSDQTFETVEYTAPRQVQFKETTLYAKWWIDCIAKL